VQNNINKKTTPLVSILLNCYNAEKFIAKAIDSVICQSYNNWELIVWDDGSTDNTVKILENYKDDRIFIFKKKKNVGLGKSRIEATKHLNGELITILDADDFYHKDKIFKQVEIFQKNKNISICSTWAKIFDNDFKLKRIFASELNEDKLKKRLRLLNIIPHSSIMYKKKDALKVGWYSNKLEFAQDYDLTIKLIKEGKLFLIKEFLTNICQPNTNMSQSEPFKKVLLEENIYISSNILISNQLDKKETKLLNSILDLYKIKLNLLFLKKKIIKSTINIIIIIVKNPLIIFKFKISKILNNLEE
tara:strand:- start:216 stop:1127 length:912 start_codon:yes stop_codon:yes gene_type:complete